MVVAFLEEYGRVGRVGYVNISVSAEKWKGGNEYRIGVSRYPLQGPGASQSHSVPNSTPCSPFRLNLIFLMHFLFQGMVCLAVQLSFLSLSLLNLLKNLVNLPSKSPLSLSLHLQLLTFCPIPFYVSNHFISLFLKYIVFLVIKLLYIYHIKF